MATLDVPTDTDVVIIGGGGCGLSLSSFLSNHGIAHVLFERHPGTSILPKSHYTNQRSMEIFRQHDMAEDILASGATVTNFNRVRWVTSLGGDGPFDGREYGHLESFGGSSPKAENSYVLHCPIEAVNLPQMRLEPILRDHAEKRNPFGVKFSHNITHVEQSDMNVTVHYLDPNQSEHVICSKYVVAADGGKTVGPMVGIELDGIDGFANIITVHFKADLSSYWQDPDFMINVMNNEGDASILPMGPTWGRFSEEWILHYVLPYDTTQILAEFNTDAAISTLKETLKTPDVNFEILQISPWSPESCLADTFRKGRVLVAGDAAHRHPPAGGLGLNSGIADAHNLAWKLALVLKGKAESGLLDSYELERRPAAKRNCDWTMNSMMNRVTLATAVGIKQGDISRNTWRLMSLFAEDQVGASARALLQHILETQKIEFSAHDLDIGTSYENGALISDGTPRPLIDLFGQIYHPSTRPGSRLPHAWLQVAGQLPSGLISTHDLVGGTGDFVLITDQFGRAWQTQARLQTENTGVNIRVVRIGNRTCRNQDVDYVPLHGHWDAVKGTAAGGAVLVRPDNVIAWRSQTASVGCEKDLAKSFAQILGKQWKFQHGRL